MGVEVNALIPVYLRASFVRKHDCQDYIDECNENINRAKARLRQLAFMTEPKKFCPDDQDVDIWLENEIEEHLETIEYDSWKRYIAEQILEHWDTMHHPNGCTYSLEELGVDRFDQLARMSTDFCPDCYRDGSPVYYEDDFDRNLYKNVTGHEYTKES